MAASFGSSEENELLRQRVLQQESDALALNIYLVDLTVHMLMFFQEDGDHIHEHIIYIYILYYNMYIYIYRYQLRIPHKILKC